MFVVSDKPVFMPVREILITPFMLSDVTPSPILNLISCDVFNPELPASDRSPLEYVTGFHAYTPYGS